MKHLKSYKESKIWNHSEACFFTEEDRLEIKDILIDFIEDNNLDISEYKSDDYSIHNTFTIRCFSHNGEYRELFNVWMNIYEINIEFNNSNWLEFDKSSFKGLIERYNNIGYTTLIFKGGIIIRKKMSK